LLGRGVPASIRHPIDRYGVLAFSIYLAFAIITLGRALIGHFCEVYIGQGSDPTAFIWAIAWWLHALIHGQNPFLTKLLWAPDGLNLAWMTALPLPSLLAAPVTWIAGPLAAFNLISLLASPLAGWAAFLLCRRICGSWWSALIGGYVFGFSAYMLGANLGRPHLSLVFPLPLGVLLFLREMNGEVSRWKFIVSATGILIAEFLISIEIFATMTAVGAVTLFLAWSFTPADTGRKVVSLIPPIVCAYGFAMLLMSPYLYCLFALPWRHGPIWSAEAYSCDLSNFLVPAPTSELGTVPFIARIAAPFCKYGPGEVAGYLGLPLIIIFAIYAWHCWREPVGKLLVDLCILMAVIALGPLLHIGGVVYCGGPFKAFRLFPLLDKALPARFMVYVFLLLAIITSIWFATNRLGAAMNIAIAASLVAVTLPNLSASFWTTADDTPIFFKSGISTKYFAPDENVLVLPFGIRGDSMLWQAESGMNFRMVGGWTAFAPSNFEQWPIYDAFLNTTYVPDAPAQLGAFMAHHATHTVVIANQDPDADDWIKLLLSMHATKQTVGGVTICRLDQAALFPYAKLTAAQMRTRAASALFARLVLAAAQWTSEGNNPSDLNPVAAEQRGMLPRAWRIGSETRARFIVARSLVDAGGKYCCGVWLGQVANGDLAVGIYSSYDAVEPLINRCRELAEKIFFPYPDELVMSPASIPADTRGLMVMEFERKRIAAIAARCAGPATLKQAQQTRSADRS
jgi:hypothetical protein